MTTSSSSRSTPNQSSNFASQGGQPAISGYKAPIAATATTPGMDCLGCGINAATGSYLLAYKEQVFDLTQLVNVTQTMTLNRMWNSCVAEQDSVSYLVEQTGQAGISGGYAGFAASVETSFGQTQSEESTNSLATYMQITQLYQLTVPVSAWPNILASGFKQALYTMDPQEFYTKYGAYFTSTVVVGGSLTASVQTAQTESFDQNTFSVDAKASYDSGIAHGSVDTSYSYTSTTTHTNYQCNTGIVMVGGNLAPSYLPSGALDVNAWTQSIPSNPAVVGWNDLVPMWELITDNPARVAELQGAIDAYFSAPNPYLTSPLTMKTFTSTSGTSAGPESVNVLVDSGYKVLCGGASLTQDNADNQFLTGSSAIGGDSPNQWSASAKSVCNVTQASLTGYAIAVYDPSDLLDVKEFSAQSPNAQHPQASCAIDSSYVLTGGGVTTNPSNTNGLMLTASFPSDQSTWQGNAKDHSSACPGTINVNAIGIKWRNATGKPKLVVQITSSQSPISNVPTQSVGAGSNCALVGGGAWDNYGSGYGNMLQNSFPSTAFGKPVWFANGHDCKSGDSCILTVYAIGLKVLWESSDGTETYMAFGPGCLTPPPGFKE